MLLAVTEQQLEHANWAIVIVGIAMALAWIVQWLRRGDDPLLAAQERPSHLRPECIPACMLAYLFAAMIAQDLVERFVKPGLPAETAGLLDRVVPPTIGALLGAVACIWYGSQGFDGGARGYGLSLRAFGRDVLAGVCGWFIAFAVCAGLLLVCERAIEWWRPGWRLPEHPVLEALRAPGMPAWVHVFTILGPIAVAPVAEELFFRGIVQSFLKQHLGGRWRPILLGAVVFGGAHYIQPQVVLPLTALGIILGYLYERRGSLVAPIALHVVFNLRTIVWQALLTGGGVV
jgi:membrane protease YdiL (CAAX protease family)